MSGAKLRSSILYISKRALGRLYPYVRWKISNWIGLTLLLSRRYRLVRNHHPSEEYYNKSFWDFFSTVNWTPLVEAIHRHFNIRSVAEVGCGTGTLLRSLKVSDSHLKVVGFEFSPDGIKSARAAGLEVHQLDLCSIHHTELQWLISQAGKFDLSIALEVGEHLPPWTANKLVYMLVLLSDTVLFSAAKPNQGGTMHVNEQPISYWIRKFRKHGYKPPSANELMHADLVTSDLPSYYKRVVCFEKE